MLVTCDGFCMPKLRLEERTGRWRQYTERTPIFRAKSFISLLFFERSCLYLLIIIKQTKPNPGDQSWITNSYLWILVQQKKWLFSSFLRRFEWFSLLRTQDFDENHLKLLITQLEIKSLPQSGACVWYLGNYLSFEANPMVLV